VNDDAELIGLSITRIETGIAVIGDYGDYTVVMGTFDTWDRAWAEYERLEATIAR
jgi:hypothetical protein